MSEQNTELNNGQYFQEITDVDDKAPVRSDVEFLVVQSDSEGAGKELVRQGLNKVATALNEAGLGGLSSAVKEALLGLLGHVAFTDAHGSEYLDALEAAMYPPISIEATFGQGQNVIYNTDSLDTLRQYLTVTATYSGSRTETVTAYTLSGTLTVGTSTITASYGGKTDTFTVTVTKKANGLVDGTYNTTVEGYPISVSGNTISYGSTVASYKNYSIPFKFPIELHAGDTVKFAAVRDDGANNNKAEPIGLNGELYSDGGNFCPYRTTPIAKTVTIASDMTATSLYVGSGAVSRSFTLVLYVNGEEVFN